MSAGDPLFDGPGEMAARMRELDWSRTPLGAPAVWPQSLRTVVRILLTSRYAMWMGFGPELTFFYNDAYRPTLGEKHAWALGAPAQQVWAEIWPAIVNRVEIVMRQGEATWDEGLLLFPERRGYPEETYHTFSYSPLPDDHGAVGGLLCVVTEETERVIGARRLALLRELAARLAATKTTDEVLAAVEGSLAGDARDLTFSLLYLLEPGGERAHLALRTGLPAGHPGAPETLELAGPGAAWPLPPGAGALVDLPPETDWPRAPWTLAPARALALPLAQQGQARPAGLFIGGLSPNRPHDDAYADFVRLFAGQVAAGLANAHAYEEERRRAEALAEIDRAKTIFFSNVSHEFRTPLTLMLGPLGELLAEGHLPDEARRALALVHRNGQRLLKLVNTLLDFSRIEAGRLAASYAPTDLAELTADLASAFRSATDKAGLRLVIDCPPQDEPAYVDRDMWEKIVLNLVSNAFKFTLEGEIAVRLRRAGEGFALTVQDTGAGIAAHELPRLFERFHRIEGATGRTHEGSGIGLALVHELVKLHGGAIAVDSAPGRGSAFTVTIPRGREHLPRERVADAPAPATQSSARVVVEEALRWLPDEALAPAANDPGAQGGRVVLADDNADMRDYIRRLLGARWEVEAVRDGSAALQAVRRRRPDLVLTDVMMPELDGFGLLAALREDERTRELPVLMLSARAGEEARLEGLQAGATEYLVKPFSARELSARVESLILRGRLRAVEEAQSRRMAGVFAQAPVGIAILRGPSHVFELANPSYLELVGRRDIVGAPVRAALPELHGQGIFELLDAVYTTGERHIGRSLRIELARGPAGAREECFFDFVYQPLLGDEGAVEGIAAVVFEVTALAKARREAEVANRAKDEFLAMLGHELRNPLAPILTALQLMRLRGSTGAEKEVTIIERQVRHLVGLVDDLLDVSRITRGKITLKRERVELAGVVARAIEQASPLLDQRRHDLQVEVARELAVDADPTRLAQVIANLLTNAAKYTRPGGRVSLRAYAEQDALVIRVRDTGMGIDPEILPHIFEPFTQERQAIDRSQGGLGLGLAIVRSLVRLHGGSVTATSEGRERGAEFTVRLPRAQQPAAPRGQASELAPATASACRILIVDDNEDASEVLAQALGLAGHVVRAAHDGPSALRVAAEFAPDVAILDIGLPVMDGYELARRFGEDPRLRRTRLVAVTGYGQRQDRDRSAAAGFAAHMVKPVDLDALQAVLVRLRDAGDGRA